MADRAIVWLSGRMTHGTTRKLCVALGAGAKVRLPAWLAVNTTVPTAPVSVTVLPDTVAGPLTANVTGRPELAVGKVKVNGASQAVWPVTGAKVIVCPAGGGTQAATTKLCATFEAAENVPLP